MKRAHQQSSVLFSDLDFSRSFDKLYEILHHAEITTTAHSYTANWQTYMNDNISVPVSHAAHSSPSSSPSSSPRRDRTIQAHGGVASASDDKKLGSAVFDSAALLSPCTPGRIIVRPARPRASEPDADMSWAKSLGREARIRVEEENRRTYRDGRRSIKKRHAPKSF